MPATFSLLNVSSLSSFTSISLRSIIGARRRKKDWRCTTARVPNRCTTARTTALLLQRLMLNGEYHRLNGSQRPTTATAKPRSAAAKLQRWRIPPQTVLTKARLEESFKIEKNRWFSIKLRFWYDLVVLLALKEFYIKKF